MHDNKVSDKVIWEGNITSDEEISFSQYNPQSQSQMMFCYKCNNVIPSNSTYCPYCQIKLYTECPKCGIEYSSQYPACNHCGTNRLEYIESQIREKERIEAKKREEKLRQDKLEREQREALQRQEDRLRQKLKAFHNQKDQIKNTKEYQTTYSVLKEALESTRWKHVLCVFDTDMRDQCIRKYIQKKGYEYDLYMLNYVLNTINCSFYQYTYDVLERLSELCINAYKDKNGLPINLI